MDPRTLSDDDLAAFLRTVANRRRAAFHAAITEDRSWEASIEPPDGDTIGIAGADSQRHALEQLVMLIEFEDEFEEWRRSQGR